MNRLLAALLASFCLASPARANDSVAMQGAGGLILVNADAISMETEELYVSAEQIRVDYVFRNNGKEPRTYLVAFPMPQIDPPDYLESDISIPSPDSDNFMNFTVTAGGETITPKLEMRALSGGIDITDRLTALAIPLNPLAEATRKAVAAMPRSALSELEAMGAIKIWDDAAGPAWSLKSTYYWMQGFAAEATLAVSHSYTPAIGSTFFYYDTAMNEGTMARDYCIDTGTAKAIRGRLARVPMDNPYLMQRTIAYILTTGANWQGAIGDFRLVVDKGSTDAIVSFCMDGVTKIAPTRFEVRKKDFYPTEELRVLLLTPPL